MYSRGFEALFNKSTDPTNNTKINIDIIVILERDF